MVGLAVIENKDIIGYLFLYRNEDATNQCYEMCAV